MATVGQPGALRRITVHYANSPTRSTGDADLDDLDDDLLQFVLADLLSGQVCCFVSESPLSRLISLFPPRTRSRLAFAYHFGFILAS